MVTQTLAERNNQADVYFVSCAAIRALGAIDELERRLTGQGSELGKPTRSGPTTA